MAKYLNNIAATIKSFSLAIKHFEIRLTWLGEPN